MNQVTKVDFRIHDWIDGKYKVERVLGHSQHDSKFKVVDRQGNQYMLKLLNLWQVETARQASNGTRTESEIAGCSIPSNYLTTIVGSGLAMGNPYLVTQFYNSVDLTKYRPKGNIGNIIAKVLFGLKDLHVNGKVHGNLTNENVLVLEDGSVLLTNYVVWGNRNQVALDYRNGKAVPSKSALIFVAPERFNLEKSVTILPTADMYSVGVLAYYLLTGRYPFGLVSNISAYLQKSAEGAWNRTFLGRHNSKWEEFLTRTLSPEPKSRPQSIDEALALLPEIENCEYQKNDKQPDFNRNPRNGLLLRILQGDDFGVIYRLGEMFNNGAKRILTLGRQDESVFNLIPIKETATSFVSRRHSTIELDDTTGNVYIRDGQWDKDAKESWVRSLNGTYVNSTEVTDEGHELIPGDIVSVGDVKLRVEGY